MWHRNNVPRLNPDEAKAAARTRVDRLETALAALGETESAEARGLHAALKEAQRAAQERPLAAQVGECQAFIKRSQARLARLEQEQVRQQKELDAALARMVRFREEMIRAVPVVLPPAESNSTQPARVPDLVAEIERLRSRVAEMESEQEEARKKRSRSLSVVAALGRFTRRSCGARQDHGDIDQSREHVGSEFEPIQSVGLTCLPYEALHIEQFSIVPVRRVPVFGARRVRVGEASNPGPDDVPLTQWESGAECSVPNGGSGLMAIDDEFLAPIQPVPEEVVDALEFDLGQSASVFRDVEESRGRPSVVNIADASDEEVSDTESEEVRPRQRLRLTWNSSPNSQGHRDARAAENIVRELAGRIGPIPEGGEVPAIVRRQRWSPINVPLMWAAAGGEPSTPVLQWLVQCFPMLHRCIFMRGSRMHRKQCEQVGELFVACSGCGVLRNGKTSQFGSEAKDSRARVQGTTLLRGPRSLF